MIENIPDEIISRLDQASRQYYRLVLLVAPAGSGKTAAIQVVSERVAAPLFNINLELSRRMLDLTVRQRTMHLPRIISDILEESAREVVLLDNIEVLFDRSLKQDPLRLLQGLSRRRTLVAAWNGTDDEGHIFYAAPDHPEYRRYQIKDFLAITPKDGS